MRVLGKVSELKVSERPSQKSTVHLHRPGQYVPHYLVAIDPGVNAGVAVFDIRTKQLVLARVIKEEGRTWDDRVMHVAYAIEDVLRLLPLFPHFAKILCEYPAFMPSPGGVKIAKRGDLVKLAYLCGMIHSRMRMLTSTYVRVPVRDWKGMASKDVINGRIERIVSKGERRRSGMSVDRSHDWDAVGIGLWALERK